MGSKRSRVEIELPGTCRDTIANRWQRISKSPILSGGGPKVHLKTSTIDIIIIF